MTISDPSPTTPLSNLPRRDQDPRSRRRRRGNLNLPRDAEGRAALLAGLAHRAYPTYELFVFAALSGGILALGYLMDSQALLLFGALVAPLLLPWVGLLLGSVTGSLRFFFETLAALLVSATLVFVIGLLAGFASRAFPPRTFEQAYVHARLWWPDLIILALGAVILAVSFVRSESKPFLPSVILAYEFFLPLSAGGFGLGSGLSGLWPHGLLVFATYFAWATLFGLIAILSLRIAPGNSAALVFTAALGLLLLAILAVLLSTGSSGSPFASQIFSPVAAAASIAQDPPGPQPQPSAASSAPTSASLPSPTSTLPAPTLEPTQAPSQAPTMTMTIEPTPQYAQVNAPRGGAVLRSTPGGAGITTLDNFTYVELRPETEFFSGYTWVHVIAITNGDRQEGWIVQQYLETPTPGSIATLTPAS